jgi:hypothetical protein
MPSGKPLYNVDGSENPEVANILKKVMSFSDDMGKWARSDFKTTTAEQLEERIAICKLCEFWNASGFAGTGKCDKCGCSTQAKLRMSTSKCFIDKWGPVDVRQVD